MLSVDDIKKSSDRRTKEIEIPEWGGAVLLAEFTAADRDWFEGKSLQIAANVNDASIGAIMKGFRSETVRRGLVDAELKPMFGKSDNTILGKSSLVIDRLFDESSKLNEFDEEEIEKATENLNEAQS